MRTPEPLRSHSPSPAMTAAIANPNKNPAVVEPLADDQRFICFTNAIIGCPGSGFGVQGSGFSFGFLFGFRFWFWFWFSFLGSKFSLGFVVPVSGGFPSPSCFDRRAALY